MNPIPFLASFLGCRPQVLVAQWSCGKLDVPTSGTYFGTTYGMQRTLAMLFFSVADLTTGASTRKGVQPGAKPFTKNSLHNLLTNFVYIGKIRHKENVYDEEHESIVPTSGLDGHRRRFKRSGRNGGTAVGNKHGALLRGILRCECCDSVMSHTYTSKGSRQYR